MTTPATLLLEDNSLFEGVAIGVQTGYAVGEVVFNTAMTGYQEILTDPSYAKQLVTLTYPHIGNTGVNSLDVESHYIQVAGLIIYELPIATRCWREEEPLASYLASNHIMGIAGIDTRKLTRLLRAKGSMNGVIVAGAVNHLEQAQSYLAEFAGLKGTDLAKAVTTQSAYEWQQGSWQLESNQFADSVESYDYHVVVIDFGVKHNILRMLVDRNCKVTVVPATTPANDILALKPDGVLLSNGPGDPEPCDYAIHTIKQLITKQIPILGICLGHQLLALASGAKTVKMATGHHGANHPVVDHQTGRVAITSQNHGFAVSIDSLSSDLMVSHRSLFDGTVQGIRWKDQPFIGFQGHPEASPGPHDIVTIFDEFIALMDR